MRRAARVDLTHAEIVRALIGAGCSVQSLATVGEGCPDLLVARAGHNYLIECKSKGGTLSEVQDRWHSRWRTPVHTCWTAEEALRAVGFDL